MGGDPLDTRTLDPHLEPYVLHTLIILEVTLTMKRILNSGQDRFVLVAEETDFGKKGTFYVWVATR